MKSTKNIPLQPTEVRVSFNIIYHSPVQEALVVIHWKLPVEESLGERTKFTATHFLDLCLRTTYFSSKESTTNRKMVLPLDH